MPLSLTANGLIDNSGRTLLNSSGTPLQFIQSIYTAVYENTSSQSEYDLPGVLGDGSFGITPTNSSTKLLFQFEISQGQEDTWRMQAYRFYYKIGSGGSWNNINGTTAYSWMQSTNGHLTTHRNQVQFFHGTTSTVYFKVTANQHGNGNTLHLNQNSSSNTQSNNNQANTSTSMNVWEFSA